MNPGHVGLQRERKQKHHIRKGLLATENGEFFARISPVKAHLAGVHTNKSGSEHVYRHRKAAESKPYSKQERMNRHYKQAKTSGIKKDTVPTQQSRVGVGSHNIAPSSTAAVEPSVVETRRLTIKTKLMTFSDPSFNRVEEQEINQRADVYALTTPPDSIYYVLPENVDAQPLSHSLTENGKSNGLKGNMKERPKRKRRSYNNIDCFVTHTRKDDVFGGRHCLPAGTKLIKPPKKLVELVAEAVDRSPDGLLQVQQIYAVLQNKFPYFRYMDKLAISSWRSSIRHALYQKWFRKIRFCTEAISSKGCFWAINHSLNPSEWIVPYNPENVALWKNCRRRCSTPFLDMLQEPNVEEEEHLKDVIQIAKEYGISFPECVAEAKGEFQALRLNIPSPVRDPDPILVACVPDYSVLTPKAKRGQFDKSADEGFDELPFKLTPLKISQGGCSGSHSENTSTSDDSALTWTSPSFDELPTLFSPTYSMHPYGMPVFPDQSNSQN